MTRFIETQDLLILPKRFSKAEIDEKTNPILKEIASKFLDNVYVYLEYGIAPSFFGNPGVGKTYIAAVIAKEAYYNKKIPTYWADAVTTLNRLMDYRDFRKEKYFDLKRTITRIPFLIIDDFGHLQRYERTRELFFEIVNSRYASKLSTMFTANFEVGKTSWKFMEDCFGSALVRRIKEMSKGLLFSR